MFVPLVWFSALSFLGYGIACLVMPYMVTEFGRYGMPGVRTITGVLQVLASAGLLLGLVSPQVGALAAAGLAAQMLAGIVVRVRIEDSFVQCLPAAFYLLINGLLAYWFLTKR